MSVVGRAETPIFTWNPVEQIWVQEGGGAAKPPPAPNDVHAIQTWFLDPEEHEWIQTVLGPMGRQLAAQWQGAHRVPESAVIRKAAPARRRNPLPFLLAGVVLVALIGGVAVAAPGLVAPHDASAAPAQPSSAAAPTVAPSVDASAPATSAPPDATTAPTAAPTGPVVTARPRTPAPTPQPTPPPPPPDYVSPVIGPVGTVFHITFTGLPAAAPYRTSYTRGSVTTGYVTGEVPSNGVVTFDLRTNVSSFPPDTYFFTIRAGNAVKTVTFRLTS
jgi:hypothetical protein